jgi:predicted outer membrane repeat protein
MDKRNYYKTAVIKNNTTFNHSGGVIYVSVSYSGDNYYCTTDICGVVHYIHELELDRFCL